MKRQIKNALIIAIVGIININGVCDPPAPLPTCTWDDKGEIQFFSVKLYPPASQNYYGFTQDFPMQGFSEIFSRPQNRPTKSTIDIATSVSGCTGTMSQSKLFTEASQIGVDQTRFKNLKRVNNVGQSVHNVTITMVSGPYTSMTNATETGTIIWTKKIDTNPYNIQQPALSSVGVFKSDRANVIKVYVKDNFKELELY